MYLYLHYIGIAYRTSWPALGSTRISTRLSSPYLSRCSNFVSSTCTTQSAYFGKGAPVLILKHSSSCSGCGFICKEICVLAADMHYQVPTPILEIHLKYQSYQFGCWLQMETSKFACLIYLVAGGNAVDDTFGARETGGLHCIAILDGRPKWWYVDRRSHILQPMSSDFVLFDNT